MNTLFFHLIHTAKIKRWFGLLEILEERPVMTSAELAKVAKCTMRTIQSDTKEIKRYFGQTIRLLGDEDGHHLNLVNPQLYMSKKQELLENESLFYFLADLLEGTAKKNQEWARDLSISPALFGRLKRTIAHVLEENYRIGLTGEDNQLIGEEAAIRQLMRDFYYTLPHYPKKIEEQIDSENIYDWYLKKQVWMIEPSLLIQWGSIASKRLGNGHQLPESKELSSIQQKLANAFDLVIQAPIRLPAQEKAALFLLALNDEQFIHLPAQQEFIRQFSSDLPQVQCERGLEDTVLQFFYVVIYLMNHFFQLPIVSLEGNQSHQAALLNELTSRYLKINNQIKKSLLVSYELSGTRVLQEWIKRTIQTYLDEGGYYVIEHVAPSQLSFVHQLKVTNIKQEKQGRSAEIVLSQVPDEEEIIQAFKGFVKKKENDQEEKQ